MTVRSFLCVTAWLAALLAAPRARAADDAAARARADALFKQGQKLLDAERVSEACASFAESQRVDPRLGRLLNLAFCHERENKTASAWAEYKSAAAWAVQRDPKPERATFARKRAERLEPRLSLVTLHVAEHANVAALEIDGEPVAKESWSTPQPLDPGRHVVAARGPGRRTRTASIDVGIGPSSQRLEIAALEPESAPSANGANAAAVALAASPAKVAPASSSGRTTWGAVALGAGAVAIGVGTYFGVRVLRDKSVADGACTTTGVGATTCDASGVAALDDAHRWTTVSTVALAGGAVLAGVGGYLVLSAPSHTAVRVAAAPGGGARASWVTSW